MSDIPDTEVNINNIYQSLKRRFSSAEIDAAALDAKLLIQAVTGFSAEDMIARAETPLTIQQLDAIEEFAKRRLRGEPVSRILGHREFWGLDFIVTPATLDPRSDTETLVTAALAWARSEARFKDPERPLRILDLGTGSGCILIALLSELPQATGVGVDLNPGAVDAARENAGRLGVAARAVFHTGCWFEALPERESFDLIVSNPPYIPNPAIESLAREVKNHDPILALDGGADGLEAYELILTEIKNWLEPQGRAFFEIGFDQHQDLLRLAEKYELNHCDSHPDLAGILRVVEISSGKTKKKFDGPVD